MTNNMTIGPAVMIGGNQVQVTKKGKVQITNPKGEVVTLSQDQFKKQSLKNMDKLQNGEDVEFKKGNKIAKIIGAGIGVALVTLGVVFRKEISKFVKDFSFKKTWDSVKNFYNSLTKKENKLTKKETPRNVFSGETPVVRNSAEAKVAKETLNLKQKTIAQMTHNMVEDYHNMVRRTKGAIHNSKQRKYEKLLA